MPTEPAPLILDNAGLKIGDGGDPSEVLTELACVLNHIELTPDVSVTTLTTMCGEKDYPGVVKWSLIATLYQSTPTPPRKCCRPPWTPAGRSGSS